MLFSEQAYYREQKTLKKQVLEATENSIKTFKQLSSKLFSCAEDAKQELENWLSKQSYAKVTNLHFIEKTQYQKVGRPSKGDAGKIVYQISGNIYTCLASFEQTQAEKGLFIIATNECEGKLDMETLLTHYKSQQSVERGFRFLKSPDFLTSSFYLKKPERVEALLMIMTCCLMIYAALEHFIREKLKKSSSVIPDLKGKPTNKPTARWVFYCFQGIHELTIEKKVIVINLKSVHKIVLACLGSCYQQIYF